MEDKCSRRACLEAQLLGRLIDTMLILHSEGIICSRFKKHKKDFWNAETLKIIIIFKKMIKLNLDYLVQPLIIHKISAVPGFLGTVDDPFILSNKSQENFSR